MNGYDPTTLLSNVRLWGADLAAVADTARLAGIETEPPDLLEGYPRAVVIAARLSDGVMEGVVSGPTPLYSQHYQRVNALLDDVALRICGFLQAQGAKALPIPASQILCEKHFVSYVSHKAVAVAAGLGWQGKSTLLVTPEFGPRVRLATVLTDLDLAPGAPMRNRCGSCDICSQACPAGAIRNVQTDLHHSSREEALDLGACLGQLARHGERPHIRPYLCGVCVSSCPWGRKKRKGGGRSKGRPKSGPA